MNAVASDLRSIMEHARLHSLWGTTSRERLPMVAAQNVAELEARAMKRRDLHRAALDIARRAKTAATRAINLRIAGSERRALACTLEELRYWHGVHATCRASWRV